MRNVNWPFIGASITTAIIWIAVGWLQREARTDRRSAHKGAEQWQHKGDGK